MIISHILNKNLNYSYMFRVRAEWWIIGWEQKELNRFDNLDKIITDFHNYLDPIALEYGFPENNKIDDWDKCQQVHMWSDLLMAEILKDWPNS